MTTDTLRAQVASATPGRLRIRLHRDHRRNGELARLREAVERRPGVHAVEANAASGSLLVRYDRDALDHGGVVGMLREAGVVLGEAAEVAGATVAGVAGEGEDFDQSILSTRVLDALTDLDRRLSRATSGLIDVKALFPLTLGALAVRQVVLNGLGLGTVPGYVLLWYTFDSFYKLHGRSSSKGGGADPATTDDAERSGGRGSAR